MKKSPDTYDRWWDASFSILWFGAFAFIANTDHERQLKAEALRRQFRVIEGGKRA